MLVLRTRTKQHVISVPLTAEEINRLNRYLDTTGRKKGRVTREALLSYLDEEESNATKTTKANRRSSGGT